MANTMYELQKLMYQMAVDGYFPGANFSISNNEISMSETVGYKSILPTKELNSLDTLYDMASLSKVIVTNTILTRALQQQRIYLDTKVKSILRRFSHFDITIYDLVTHSSGLPADFDIPNIHSDWDFEKQLTHLKQTAKVGEDVVYSDPGFVILGLVLEEIYNKPLDQIAKEEIFEPLGMKTATYHPIKDMCAPTELTQERGLVVGKTHDEKGYYSNRILGHAGLFCTIDDVNKFIKMVLNDGWVNNKVYLRKEYLNLWFTNMEMETDGTIRSMGWILGNTPNITGGVCSEETLLHTGFTGTSIIIDRLNNIGIAVLSNRVHPTRQNTKLIQGRQLITKLVYSNLSKKKVL